MARMVTGVGYCFDNQALIARMLQPLALAADAVCRCAVSGFNALPATKGKMKTARMPATRTVELGTFGVYRGLQNGG